MLGTHLNVSPSFKSICVWGKEKIMEKNIIDKKQIVGTYQKSRNFGFVVPDDKKLGTDI